MSHGPKIPKKINFESRGAQRVPTRDLDLFIVRDSSIRRLRRAHRTDRRQAPPIEHRDDAGIAHFRTSETCDLDLADPVVADVERKNQRAARAAARLRRAASGPTLCARPGIRPHTNTFNPGGYDFLVHTERGGQRSWTAMIYLNEPDEGGATRFKTIGKTIQPETGKLLTWNNLLPDGTPNPATLHQGMKVRRGTKYVLTKWFRQRTL